MTDLFKKIKPLFSLEVMIVCLIFLALSCAVATFVENDYGPIGAKSFIYGQTWFEAIITILTLGIIVNIFIFKMYQAKKFFILLIHSSLIFIFVGAALTRYYGYEALMTIPENAMQNRAFSTDSFIKAHVYKDDKLIEKYEEPIIMTPLSQTSFHKELDINNKPFTLSYVKFVPNADEAIVDAKDGEAIINLILLDMKGGKSIDLKRQVHKKTAFLDFYLNQSPKDSTKAYAYFFTQDNQLLLKSNIQIQQTTLDGSKMRTIEANTALPLSKEYIYKIGTTTFTTPEFSAKGKVDVVSKGEFKSQDAVHAIVTQLEYDNKKEEVMLFSTGDNPGFSKEIMFHDHKIILSWGVREITLPFSLLLNDFKLTRYPGSNSPSEYSSDVKIYDKDVEENLEYTISMNNTLDYKGYRFFQSSYTTDESATILSINKDPGKVPTYIGYFLLFVGLIMSLFSKNGRFQKLARKKYTLSLLSLVLMGMVQQPLQANNISQEELQSITTIDKVHANELGKMLIQDYQGRIKPLNSLAIEITNKVIRKDSFMNLNANQLFLSMTIYPRLWQNVDFIAVKNDKVKEVLGIDTTQKYFSFEDVHSQFGKYKLADYLETAHAKKSAIRSTFDKEVIKVDERLNIAYKVFQGGFLTLFPKIDDNNNKWLAANVLLSSFNTTDISKEESKKIIELMSAYIQSFENQPINWSKATQALQSIHNYQMKHAKANILPSEFKIQAELWFNEFNIFERLTLVYLLLGLLLLGLIFVKIFKASTNVQTLTKITLVVFSIAFLIHTFGLGLRWYVAGHAPWSNGYESMIYISWAIILSGILFSRQSTLALANTGILSGITLFVAHLSWLEPQITTLTPVLKSYWLTIHVSVITASYGFLALSALLGFIMLLLYIFIKKDQAHFESISTAIKESRRINEMSMMIGLVLLVIGNFLGAIWANESWGRYWGWDPKETWTLISIIIYAIILHLHYIKGMASHYIFAALSLVSYASIVMTYFGVNYYLAGKHSYAAGDPIPIPTFVPVSAIVIILMITLSFRNRKAL